MIYPPSLKNGSRIAIVSPAGAINPDFIDAASQIIKQNGFELIEFPSSKNRFFQFGGSDKERLSDLQTALDDERIDAILCSRGGYGVIRIIDKIDFTNFIKNPKWIIGYSDITNLHLAMNKLNVCSLHANMAKAISENKNLESVKQIFEIIKGEIPEYSVNSHDFNVHGICSGELIGGNLSIIYSLQGTQYEIDTNNKILFIEDIGEYLYHLDRMMINLKISGKLENIKGLIVGAFTDMKDNPNPFGKSAYEIIREHVAGYNYPICFDFPVGHIDNNLPLICGQKYKLCVESKTLLQLNE